MILSFDFVERLGGGLVGALIAGSILAVIAIIIGFVCVSIMKKKGYDTLVGWFFCGLCLGVIGLIICLCIEDKTKQIPPSPFDRYINPPFQNQPPYPSQPPMQNQPFPDHQTARQCPHCGMTNPIEARFCNGCGNKLD